MAHCMKMTKGAVGHMFKHYERAKEKGEYVKFGNEDIETKRSHLNYNLAPERKSQGDFVKQRCSEVKCLNRKDVNVACSWVVTLPKDFKELNKDRDEREFFKGTYKFLEERYGKDNVVSAYVHMDEVTPHMHFCFVPVVYDKKKENYKVSAKEVVSRYDLQTFHTDLKRHLEETWGLQANVLNQATIEGNKSIDELKRGTAVEKLNNALEEVQKAEGHIKLLEDNKNALEGQIRGLEGRILSLQEVNKIKIKKPLFGGEKAIINMPYQDAINLQRTAQRVSEIEQREKELQKQKENLAREREEVRKIPLKEQRERIQLQKENDDLTKQIRTVNRIMEKRPDLKAEFQKEAHTILPKVQSKGIGR